MLLGESSKKGATHDKTNALGKVRHNAKVTLRRDTSLVNATAPTGETVLRNQV